MVSGTRQAWGVIGGTLTGRLYENRWWEFRRWDGGQIAIIKDNIKKQLIGKRVESFDQTRWEIRKAVANCINRNEIDEEKFFKPLMSEELVKVLKKKWFSTKDFIKKELYWMQKWFAPLANESQYTTVSTIADMKVQIHHKNPIFRNGAVHNLDNLVITSPRMHSEGFLTPARHYGRDDWK